MNLLDPGLWFVLGGLFVLLLQAAML